MVKESSEKTLSESRALPLDEAAHRLVEERWKRRVCTARTEKFKVN